MCKPCRRQTTRDNLAKLQHLLFTHSHDDHFAVRELQYLSPNFAPCRKKPLNVWATNEVIRKMIPEMDHFYERAPLRFHSLMPLDTVTVGNLDVTPITAHHKSDELCLNFILRENGEGGKTLLYTCDTGWYDPPTWEYLKTRKLDCVIMECGKGNSRSEYDGHLSINEVIQVQARLMDDNVITPETPLMATETTFLLSTVNKLFPMPSPINVLPCPAAYPAPPDVALTSAIDFASAIKPMPSETLALTV